MAVTITHQLDAEGYLINKDSWNAELAVALADYNKITLSETHWFIIHYLREFYQEFPTLKIPAMRIVIKKLREEYGDAKGNSFYFHQLFPEGLVQAYKIAGLPKTGRCRKNSF